MILALEEIWFWTWLTNYNKWLWIVVSDSIQMKVTAGSWHIAYWMHIAYCILSAALSTVSSFRIWNSSTGILSLPGASVRNSARGKGHEEGGSAYAKAGSSLRSPPGNSRASTSKPESAYFLLCALTYTSDFTGGCPPLPLSEKRVSLQLQLIIPGCDSV